MSRAFHSGRSAGHVHCAATPCAVTVQPGMLMCREHWFSVPKVLRDSIWRTWRARQVSHYQDYVRQAVDFVDAMPDGLGQRNARDLADRVATASAIGSTGGQVRWTGGRLL